MNYFYRFSEEDFGTQGIDLTLAWSERGRGLPPALQALVEKGNALMERGQYPEAVLKFHEALKASPTCQEARDGLERAYRLMQGR
jgi:Flp pilus assembly protein TadD